MTEATQATFRLTYHVIIAMAVALIAPLTGFAWMLAIPTGLVIAADDRDRRSGIPVRARTRFIRVLAVTGGIVGMLSRRAPMLGGLIALAIVALTIFSERFSADALESDRTIARLLLAIGAIVGFVVIGSFVDADFSIVFGS